MKPFLNHLRPFAASDDVFVLYAHKVRFPRRYQARWVQGDVATKQKAQQLGMTYEQAKSAPLMLRRLEVNGLSTTSPE
jgi:hypothetical protein